MKNFRFRKYVEIITAIVCHKINHIRSLQIPTIPTMIYLKFYVFGCMVYSFPVIGQLKLRREEKQRLTTASFYTYTLTFQTMGHLCDHNIFFSESEIGF